MKLFNQLLRPDDIKDVMILFVEDASSRPERT